MLPLYFLHKDGIMGQTVNKGDVVTLAYRVIDAEGELVDDGQQPLVYVHGFEDGLFPKLQAALEGKAIGDSVTVTLEAVDAFGDYDEKLVLGEFLTSLPADIKVGDMIEGGKPGEPPTPYLVTEITPPHAVLDGNHPLAGVALTFACTVSALRRGTPEEVMSGQPAA